jgi:transcriptional regulator of acetoin/glycerol metabolism
VKNTFLDDTTNALHELERRQQQRARLDLRAQRAFEEARDQHDKRLADAAAIEGAAWRSLLAVPGMTVSTAAALCGVSVATVHRRMKEAGDER